MKRKDIETPTPASVSASGQKTGVDAGKHSTLPARLQLTDEDWALDALARAWSAGLLGAIRAAADASAPPYEGKL